MIAAARRRIRPAARQAKKRIRTAPAGALALTRGLDRVGNRLLQRAWTPLTRTAGRIRTVGGRWARRLGRRLRPAAVLLFRALSAFTISTKFVRSK